MLGSTSCES
jgi:hypothetical protein